jgi:hypothetical protein
MNNNKSIYILIGVVFVALVVVCVLKFGGFEKNKEIVDNIIENKNTEIPQVVSQDNLSIPVLESDKVVEAKKEVIDVPVPTKENILKMTFRGDFTSSGATRNYEATLSFKDNILVSGTEKYFVGQGGGCTTNCDRTDTCKISNQKWVDSISGGVCKIEQYIPLTLEEIKEKIKIKEINPTSNCGRFDICYEIISGDLLSPIIPKENIITGVITKNQYIEVTSPTPYQKISNPFRISGKSNLWDERTGIRIKDDKGIILVDGGTKASGSGNNTMYPFFVDVPYEKTSSLNGTVEIFGISIIDGSDTYKIIIPVSFGE